MASIQKFNGSRKIAQHPLSAAFPGMSQDELEKLILDIEAHGQRQPIVVYEDLILDGWHRYLACRELEITPVFEALPEGLDPVAYVQSMNLHRRHLTGSQRAAAVVACAKWAPAHRPEKGEAASPFSTTAQMAQAAEVSERTIEKAKRAQEAGLGEAVRDGKVTAERASEIAKLPEQERQAAMDAPPAPKAKLNPTPESEDVAALKAQVEELKAKVSDLQAKLCEAGCQIQELHEENEASRRILDAEDLLVGFKKEVLSAQERARVAESQRNGVMDENRDLAGRLKSAIKKLERIQKKAPEPLEGVAS